MRNLNVLWIEDVEKNQKAIWYNLETELIALEIQFNIDWQNTGRFAATTVRDHNGNRGRIGFDEDDNIIHLMLVDYNLDETLRSGQIIGIDGASVIRETKLHDHELPILFYSSNPDINLSELVVGEHNVYLSIRDNVVSEVIRLLKKHF